MMEPANGHRLARLVREARQVRAGSIPKESADRQVVAAQVKRHFPNVPCSGGALREVESGRRPASLELVVALHTILKPNQSGRSDESLGLWLSSWLADSIDSKRRSGALREDSWVDARSVAERMLRSARTATTQRHGATLADGVGAFQPLGVVVGDLRAWPARTRGDLFVNSASPGMDLAFIGGVLNKLETPAEVFSDKITVASEPDYIREALNCNLLVVGAPSVNLMTRQINGSAPFHFNIPVDWQEWDRRVRANPDLDDPQLRRLVWVLVRKAGDSAPLDEAGLREEFVEQLDSELIRKACCLTETLLTVRGQRRSLADIVQAFHAAGISDCITGQVQANPRHNEDYAVVSLARHPYSDDHMAILVAGIGGYGTAHALRLLADQPEIFEERPCGAVIRVAIPEASRIGWGELLRQTTSAGRDDVTPKYKLSELLAKLTASSRADAGFVPPAFEHWASTDLNNTIASIRRLLAVS